MDLSALLAREGIASDDDVDALVAWARQRSAALVARIEPDSPLAQMLGATLERARDGHAGDAPLPATRQPSRGVPRPVVRGVSRPYLGAAVEAALSGNEPALDLALETAAAVAEDEPAVAAVVEVPVPEDSPPPAPEPAPADDDDASIGGFNRFAFSLRRRVVETTRAEEEARRPTLTRGFELQAEESASSSAEWKSADLDLLEPPGFEARSDAARRLPGDAEASGALVLGIPDDESIDIPVLRPRPRSAGRSALALDDSGPHASAEAPEHEASPEPARTASQEPSIVHELDSGALDLASLDMQLDALELDAPPRKPVERASSSPNPPPPPAERSAPHAAERPLNGERSAAHAERSAPHREHSPHSERSAAHAERSAPHLTAQTGSGPQATTYAGSGSQPAARRTPPPPPAKVVARGGRGKPPPPPSEARPAPPAPKPVVAKKSKGKKKILELGQPVARTQPVSTPTNVAPERPAPRQTPVEEPSEDAVGRDLPSYLRDDDE